MWCRYYLFSTIEVQVRDSKQLANNNSEDSTKEFANNNSEDATIWPKYGQYIQTHTVAYVLDAIDTIHSLEKSTIEVSESSEFIKQPFFRFVAYVLLHAFKG